MRLSEVTTISLMLLLATTLVTGLVQPLIIHVPLVFLLATLLRFDNNMPVEVLNLRYDGMNELLELVIKNNKNHPLTVQSSIRLIRQNVVCDWKISDNERMQYELKMPMMSGSFETLSRCFTLIHEDDEGIVIEGKRTKAIRYRPFNSLNIGDSVNVTINYEPSSRNKMSLNKNLEVKPIVACCIGLPFVGSGFGIAI